MENEGNGFERDGFVSFVFRSLGVFVTAAEYYRPTQSGSHRLTWMHHEGDTCSLKGVKSMMNGDAHKLRRPRYS
ncbi:uncharacterized protein G2W53_006633 [Senna tora]|uniref:Uncharacterized protein n=1 Tax=Senna tora TaxID=362788 RepID=A0A835CCP4_9FABA|nr:uncharacterized protein G2W53_006633 [Senna tora]